MSLWQCSKCFKIYTEKEYLKLKVLNPEENKGQLGFTLVCTCGKPFHQDSWQLKFEDPKTGYKVLTLHWETAQTSNKDIKFDETMWYETMIMDKYGRFSQFQEQYPTREKAVEGHKLAIELVAKIIENPEKYPQDIITKFLDKIKE